MYYKYYDYTYYHACHYEEPKAVKEMREKQIEEEIKKNKRFGFFKKLNRRNKSFGFSKKTKPKRR